MTADPIRVTLLIVETLEGLRIPYHLGGSFASSIHGLPRQTHDVDLVVDLRRSQVQGLVSRLESEFYIEPEMIADAIRARRSFNVVHLKTGFKVDMFVRGTAAFDLSEFKRHYARPLSEDQPREVIVKSAEDTVLRKLQWYRLGNEVSDRQWNDVLGILRVQGGKLELDYLRHWAEELEIGDLLERALEVARVSKSE